MKIGSIIHFHRKKIGETQENLSKGICSITYLSKLENNQLIPSDEILFSLCQRLKISVDDISLLTDESILKELYQWYEMIYKNNIIESCELKKRLLLKKQYLTSVTASNYFQLFDIYHLFCFEEYNTDDFEKSILDLEEKYNFLEEKQKNFFNIILGSIFYKLNRIKKAKKYLKIVYSVVKEKQLKLKPSKHEIDSIFYLGVIYSRMGNLHESTSCIVISKKYYEKYFNFKKSIDCEILIAINYLLQKEYKIAQEKFLNLLLNAELDNKSKKIILHNLGVLFYQENNMEEALKYIIESLNCTNQLHELDLLKSYYMLSEIYRKLGNLKESLIWIQKGITIASKRKNEEYIYKFLFLKYIQQEMEFTDIIIFLEEELLPYFLKFGDKDDQMKYLREVGDLYYKNKKYKKAAQTYLYIIQLSQEEPTKSIDGEELVRTSNKI